MTKTKETLFCLSVIKITQIHQKSKSIFNRLHQQNKLGSTPYLIKLSDDRFLILWEEFEYTDNYNCVDNGVKYVQVNGNGEIISDIRLCTDLQLSSDCQPTLIDNNLTWYINGLDEKSFIL